MTLTPEEQPTPAAPMEASVPQGEVTAARVVAVVNDEVISSLDLQHRMALVMVTTRLANTPEVRARLAPQLLRTLMDEVLQKQEATRAGITVGPTDMAKGLQTLEQMRGMQQGELLNRLEAAGVPREAMLSQLRAQVAWNEFVLKTIRPQINISDDELQRERGKIQRGGNGTEVQIALLTLPVDAPEREAEIAALAEELVAQIRGGASFESVAQQLGGGVVEPFWVALDQMDPALAEGAKQAGVGAVADPIRTLQGFNILRVLGKRAVAQPGADLVEVVVKDILLKLPPDAGEADVGATLAVGREVAANPGTCSDPGVSGVQNVEDYDIQVLFRRDRVDTLPDGLREIVGDLQVAAVSEPYASREGIRMFMLCERVEMPAELADREQTFQRLAQQKLELEAQKALRRLRRDATVDVRL